MDAFDSDVLVYAIDKASPFYRVNQQHLGQDLLPTAVATAERATTLGAKYGLKAADAIHLATAIDAGVNRFITNNRRDFSKDIVEIDITYPDEL